jgi:hypothetical protein
MFLSMAQTFLFGHTCIQMMIVQQAIGGAPYVSNTLWHSLGWVSRQAHFAVGVACCQPRAFEMQACVACQV